MRTDDLGFLLAKAAQRWNELLQERFRAAGWGDVRPSYGSILVPLFEEDGLRMGELARRARLSKQTMTTMVRILERERLVRPWGLLRLVRTPRQAPRERVLELRVPPELVRQGPGPPEPLLGLRSPLRCRSPR